MPKILICKETMSQAMWVRWHLIEIETQDLNFGLLLDSNNYISDELIGMMWKWIYREAIVAVL